MLSILIPVYNYDVRSLAKELSNQSLLADIEIEILFLDDCSIAEFLEINKSVTDLPNVILEFNTVNLGFTQARNKLVSLAKFDSLLFLDSDIKIITSDFLKLYIDRIKHRTVYCGGILYAEIPPEDKSLMLKWKNGKFREEGRVKEKNLNPWVAFTAANFMISKKIIQEIPLDQQSVLYGYNDTMYGYRLMRNGVYVQHFGNPVLHEGLMQADKFLLRIESGMKNLRFFERQHYVEYHSFVDFIKVLSVESKVKKFQLKWLFKIFDFLFYKKMFHYLRHSENPNLVLFDIYKLLTLIRTTDKKQ